MINYKALDTGNAGALIPQSIDKKNIIKSLKEQSALLMQCVDKCKNGGMLNAKKV